jgi:hypothetical protein
MTVKRRTSKRREGITDSERAWLIGDRANAGFIQFTGDDRLAALWREHGDADRFSWEPDMAHPVARTAKARQPVAANAAPEKRTGKAANARPQPVTR